MTPLMYGRLGHLAIHLYLPLVGSCLWVALLPPHTHILPCCSCLKVDWASFQARRTLEAEKLHESLVLQMEAVSMHRSCWLLVTLWVCTSLSCSCRLTHFFFLYLAIHVLTTSDLSALAQRDLLKLLPGLYLLQGPLGHPGPSSHSAHPSGWPSAARLWKLGPFLLHSRCAPVSLCLQCSFLSLFAWMYVLSMPGSPIASVTLLRSSVSLSSEKVPTLSLKYKNKQDDTEYRWALTSGKHCVKSSSAISLCYLHNNLMK